MPTAIIIVEGKCDFKYIERILHVRYPNTRFSIIPAHSDNRIREIFNISKNLFGDIQKSPYHGRIFAVIDSVHTPGLSQHLEKMGMPKENVIVWQNNGIEYYYPQEIMSEIFHSNNQIQINGDQIELNGLTYSKNQLVDLVISKIHSETAYNKEFLNEFILKIETFIS